MRFMVIVKANSDSEAGKLPSAEVLSQMGKFNEELNSKGMLLAGEGLHPSSKGTRIKFTPDRKPTVIDGPFAETKELVAGFWILQARSKEEVVELMKRIPNPDNEHSEVEIRQVFEAEDFGDLVDQVPEVFEAEKRYREQEEARRVHR